MVGKTYQPVHYNDENKSLTVVKRTPKFIFVTGPNVFGQERLKVFIIDGAEHATYKMTSWVNFTIRANTAEDITMATVKELRAEAKKYGIKGYSRMRKAELEAAVSAALEQQSKQKTPATLEEKTKEIKTAYDKLAVTMPFVKSYELRRLLNWDREEFNQTMLALRDAGVINMYELDYSTVTPEQKADAIPEKLAINQENFYWGNVIFNELVMDILEKLSVLYDDPENIICKLTEYSEDEIREIASTLGYEHTYEVNIEKAADFIMYEVRARLKDKELEKFLANQPRQSELNDYLNSKLTQWEVERLMKKYGLEIPHLCGKSDMVDILVEKIIGFKTFNNFQYCKNLKFESDGNEVFRVQVNKWLAIDRVRRITRFDESVILDNPFVGGNNPDNPLTWPDTPYRQEALKVAIKIFSAYDTARFFYKLKYFANRFEKLRTELHQLFEKGVNNQ